MKNRFDYLVTVGSRNIATSFYLGSFSSSAFTSDLAAGLGEACNRFLMSESLYAEKRSGMLAGLVPEPRLSQDVAVCRHRHMMWRGENGCRRQILCRERLTNDARS